jgi:hypothetical protein
LKKNWENWGQIPMKMGVRFQLIWRDFSQENGGQIPINLAGFFSVRDTKFQQNAEFMYHENGCKPRPC